MKLKPQSKQSENHNCRDTGRTKIHLLQLLYSILLHFCTYSDQVLKNHNDLITYLKIKFLALHCDNKDFKFTKTLFN